MEIVLTIFILPKTVNSIGKASIWQSHTERHNWRKEIALHRRLWEAINGSVPGLPFKRSRLILIRHSTRPMDPDNLPASFKYVIDALKFNKIIEDDSHKHIELTCLWEKAKRNEGKITIKIESIEETKEKK